MLGAWRQKEPKLGENFPKIGVKKGFGVLLHQNPDSLWYPWEADDFEGGCHMVHLGTLGSDAGAPALAKT